MTSRALVLGGGGVTGVAWEIGMLAGLASAGVDLSDADAVIGTSAGSVVAAQLTTGRPVEEMYAAQLAAPGSEIPARISRSTLLRWGLASLGSRDARKVRARIGALALAARTVPEAQRRAVIESRVPARQWPDRRLLITAVDAESGDFVVFEGSSGVHLIDAVAASCAVPGVWPPVTIDGRRYVDGGVRSAANVDLAAGYDRVVVIAPLPGGAGPAPSVAKQVAQLTVPVTVVTPDRATRHAIGRNVLDPTRRAAAALAGRAQAAAAAPDIARVWTYEPR